MNKKAEEQIENAAKVKKELGELDEIAAQPAASHTDVMKTVSGNDNVEKVQNTLIQQTQPVQQPALNAVSNYLGGIAQPVM